MGWRHIAQTNLAKLCRVLFLHHDLNALAGLKYERDQRVDREFRRIPIEDIAYMRRRCPPAFRDLIGRERVFFHPRGERVKQGVDHGASRIGTVRSSCALSWRYRPVQLHISGRISADRPDLHRLSFRNHSSSPDLAIGDTCRIGILRMAGQVTQVNEHRADDAEHV